MLAAAHKLLQLLAHHSRPTNGGSASRPRRAAAIQIYAAAPPAAKPKPASEAAPGPKRRP